MIGAVGDKQRQKFRHRERVVRAASIGPVGFIHGLLHALRVEISIGKRVDGNE